MPFESKKAGQRTGPLNHREELTYAAIDRGFDDLSRTILSASGSHKDMQKIIEAMASSIAAAKTWIYQQG